jgi:hypothetical protein
LRWGLGPSTIKQAHDQLGQRRSSTQCT